MPEEKKPRRGTLPRVFRKLKADVNDARADLSEIHGKVPDLPANFAHINTALELVKSIRTKTEELFDLIDKAETTKSEPRTIDTEATEKKAASPKK